MKKTEAMNIIIKELNLYCSIALRDKRTKLYKAVRLLDEFLKWDEARIEGIIDETIEEFESEDNDYAKN